MHLSSSSTVQELVSCSNVLAHVPHPCYSWARQLHVHVLHVLTRIPQNFVVVPTCRASAFTDSEAKDFIAATTTPEIKAALKTATDEAAHEGAFGVPYMCLDGPDIAPSHRCWFGADALPTIAHVLGKQFMVAAISKM